MLLAAGISCCNRLGMRGRSMFLLRVINVWYVRDWLSEWLSECVHASLLEQFSLTAT